MRIKLDIIAGFLKQLKKSKQGANRTEPKKQSKQECPAAGRPGQPAGSSQPVRQQPASQKGSQEKQHDNPRDYKERVWWLAT
jgi:hypothetical protein